MKFDDLINEEGGTLKLKSGQLVFNVTKQRQRDLKNIGREILNIEIEKNNLEREYKKDPIGNRSLSSKIKLLEKRIEKLRKDKIKVASGKKSEYTVGGNYTDKKDMKVDNFNLENGDPNNVTNWKNRIERETEISDKLNKQDTKTKYRPR